MARNDMGNEYNRFSILDEIDMGESNDQNLPALPQQRFPQLLANLLSLANELNCIHQTITLTTNEIHSKVAHDVSIDGKDPNQAFMIHNLSIVPHFESCIKSLQNVVDNFLQGNIRCKWYYQQQCKAIGSPVTEPLMNLSELSPPCQIIFHSVVDILQKIHSINPCNFLPLNSLFTECLNQLRIFLNETFIINQQPPLVISLGTFIFEHKNIPMSACFLSSHIPNVTNAKGQEVFKIGEGKLYLIDKMNMNKLINEGLDELLIDIQDSDCNQESGSLVNGIAKFEPKQGFMVAEFKGANIGRHNINSRKTGNQRGITSIMEQKYCLMFTLQLELFGEIINMWTSSFPIGISSHGSQKCFGLAIVLRDYITSPLILYQLDTPSPEIISWDQLSLVIQSLLRKYLNDDTLRLNEDNLDCIKSKVEQSLIKCSARFSLEEIKWSALNYRAFSDGGRDFTFWDWLSNAFITIKSRCMLQLWKKGYIHGFLERNRAEELLRQNGIDGAFLLRFSDRLHGDISVVTYQNEIRKGSNVYHFFPTSARDLVDSIKRKEAGGYKLSQICGFDATSKVELLQAFCEV